MWDRDSPLMQIPHFDDRTVKAAKENGVEDIYTFMEAMDPSENKDYDKLVKALGLTNRQLADAADFTNNRYPNLDLSFELLEPEDITTNSQSYLQVTIERQLEEDEEPNTEVHAPFFPLEKTENWWLVVGNEKSNALYGIKRITVGRQWSGKLDFIVQTPGRQELTLSLMSDSYFGVDQAPTFTVDAAEGMDEDDEDEDEEEAE
jgi:pre-mRNA-splicing helicase BRR2